MICSSENLEPFIAASSSGGTLLKTGGVLGAQVTHHRRGDTPDHHPSRMIQGHFIHTQI
jgi:hypothetical protein